MSAKDEMVLLSTHSNSKSLSTPKTRGDPGVTYYPSSTDKMWNIEISKVFPHIHFPALDVCCGTRSPVRGMWRVDQRRESRPNVLADCNNLPFCNEVFQSVYLGHGLEHLKSTESAIKDLLRVLVPGGDLLIIHPDLRYTAGMDKTHINEYNQYQFSVWLADHVSLGYEIISVEPACPNWSFFVHLRKL